MTLLQSLNTIRNKFLFSETELDNTGNNEKFSSGKISFVFLRGHLKTFIHTVHLLQKLMDIETLPVADILNRLLLMDGGQGQPSAVLGSKHIVCWGFEDLLTMNENKEQHGTAQSQSSQQADKDNKGKND